MSGIGPFRLVLRTTADALMGLMLFAIVAFSVGAYERTTGSTHHLGEIIAASSSASDLLKFSLDDSPFIAAAVVASAVPVPHTGTVTSLRTPPETAFLLLAGIFSALVALNLAFFRHLRREYASPR